MRHLRSLAALTFAAALLVPWSGPAQAGDTYVPEDCAVPPDIDLTEYNVIIGTDKSEVIRGTKGPDFICGRLGNDKIFAFGVSLDDAQASSKLLNEVGLVVAFVVDGDCKPVVEKHAALKAAIAKGTGIDTACTALQQEIQKNEAKLREFAGL